MHSLRFLIKEYAMKLPLKFCFLFAIVSLAACEGCETCPADITVGEFELTDSASSFLPENIQDTITYTNGVEDIEVYTIEGMEALDTFIYVRQICQGTFLNVQHELADAEHQKVQYFHENGFIAYEYGLKIRLFNGEGLELDSVNVFETLYAYINIDGSQFLNYRGIDVHLNDLQNGIDVQPSLSPQIIQDTMINGVNYSEIYANNTGNNLVYYTIEDGVIAFDYLSEIWHLKQ